ncbi:hypothetical protein [Halorussus aquaticus]|uniref:Uncharacterized protein n=1 Tax=Halorussus aquaticus TaxID=2953748 RepID=A0ABD5PWV0_9EURY|nr:hypothetical protein [Halorussus aquaticus]
MALSVPVELFVLGVAAATVGLVVLAYREFRADYRTGEYHFTWGVGVVTLFLLGFAPGLVGLGLYATVERNYPMHWLFASVVGALVVIGVVGYGVDTATVTSFVGVP